ncbi:MAG: triose-phosphate isomerase [Deltaproteobacteria bacterium]|nr:triose-phosphate isomerase [Deltaproteobacteria bacterium]
MRIPFIAGNWKMHMTAAEAERLACGLKAALLNVKNVEVVIAPPFTLLYPVAILIKDTLFKLSAQDMHWEKQGAFTGEVSASMLKDAGCEYVIIGHSERRQFFGETDETVNKKVHSALGCGLKPIICVGETMDERDAGKALLRIKTQTLGALKAVTHDMAGQVVIAYEPVWAIGTGRNATPAQAEDVHSFIRGLISELYGALMADNVRIIYGGSVKPENIDPLMLESDIDGALVGGASLKAESFERIVRFKSPA